MKFFIRKFTACLLFVSTIFLLSITDNNAQSIVWAKNYGGAQQDRGKDIGLDSMSNSYISGFFTDSVSFGSLPVTEVVDTMHENIFIVKLDPNGNPLWSHSFNNGISNHGDFPFNMSVNKAGWAVITGEFKDYFLTDDGTNLPGIGATDMFLALYDPSGNLEWAQIGGGLEKDMGTGVFIDDDGMIYCTGNAMGDFTIFGNHDYVDPIHQRHIYIAQYDLAGSFVWGNAYASQFAFEVRNITGDNINSIYVGGNFANTVSIGNNPLTSLGADDGWVANFNKNGNLQWAKSFGSSDVNSYESASTLATDSLGNFYVATTFKNDISFDGNTTTTGANQNVAIASFDSNGVYKWTNVIKAGQSGQFNASCLDLLAEDNILLTGCFSGVDTVGVGNVGSSVVITPFGDPANSDAFLAAFNTINGNAMWATNNGGGDEDAGYGLAGNHTGIAYAVGTFSSFGQFGSFGLTSKGESDVDVLKFHESTSVGVSNPSDNADLSNNTIAYPNPTKDELSIVIPENVKSLKLVNALGQVVMMEIIEHNGLQVLDLMPFSAGVYYLELNGDHQVYSTKVVKQE